MRARGARLGLDMANLASTRLVVAIERGPFAAHAGSTHAGARAHAGRGPLRDRRSRFRGFRDDHRRRASSPDGRAFGTLGAPGPGEGSAHQIAALVVWLKRHGVDFGDRARFARIRGMGVGGVATRNLRQGDAIFSLPLFAPVDTAAEKASDVLSSPLRVPLVITTSVVMDQKGPLGRLARALAAAGLVARGGGGEPLAPTHRLGGVRESDHEFPLHVSATTLLALALLFTSAKATRSTQKTPSRRGAAPTRSTSNPPQTRSPSSPTSSRRPGWRNVRAATTILRALSHESGRANTRRASSSCSPRYSRLAPPTPRACSHPQQAGRPTVAAIGTPPYTCSPCKLRSTTSRPKHAAAAEFHHSISTTTPTTGSRR